MNLEPINQIKLYAFFEEFNQLIKLHEEKKLPNKILLSGPKGIGKCTFAYHLINCILSYDEEYPYDLNNFHIDEKNRYFKLNLNGSNPNVILIDIENGKKNIEINQIRNLISSLNKSSFNSKERFVLIDNIEYLNLNSINALLKIIEEPNLGIHFILIDSNKNILPTLTSRCIKFNLSLSHSESLSICEKLIGKDIKEIINNELLDYYFTPGKVYNLFKFADEYKIDLTKINLKDLINTIINENLYKKDTSLKYLIYDFIELFLSKNILPQSYDFFDFFKNEINKTKKFNLDEESLFIKFKSKLLNG